MTALSTPKEQRPADYIVYVDDFPVRRALSFDITPNFNNTEYNEIGSAAIIESIPSIITTNVSLNTNSLGTVDLFGKIMSEKATDARPQSTSGYPLSVNSGTYTEANFENACVDLSEVVREDGTTIRRTKYIPNCYLSSFDFTFPVDGPVTENYTFVGDSDYDFLGTYYADARVKPGVYQCATGIQCTGLAGVDLTLYTGVLMTINGVVVATGSNIRLVSGATAGSGMINAFNTGCGVSAVTSSDKCRLVYSLLSPASWTTKTTDACIGVPGKGGVMGYQCRAYIMSGGASFTTGSTADLALRVQNVSINGDLSREEQKELGNIRNVSKKLTTPLRINGTVEVSDNDLDLYAKLCGPTVYSVFSGYKNSDQAVKLMLDSSQLATNAKLIIEMYKTRTGTFLAADLLSTITLSGLSVTAKSTSTSSSTRGSMSWGLQGSYFTFVGTSVANV